MITEILQRQNQLRISLPTYGPSFGGEIPQDDVRLGVGMSNEQTITIESKQRDYASGRVGYA
jgi:hypothetical protein